MIAVTRNPVEFDNILIFKEEFTIPPILYVWKDGTIQHPMDVERKKIKLRNGSCLSFKTLEMRMEKKRRKDSKVIEFWGVGEEYFLTELTEEEEIEVFAIIISTIWRLCPNQSRQ